MQQPGGSAGKNGSCLAAATESNDSAAATEVQGNGHAAHEAGQAGDAERAPAQAAGQEAAHDAGRGAAAEDGVPASWSESHMAEVDEEMGAAAPVIHGLGSLVQHIKAEQSLK